MKSIDLHDKQPRKGLSSLHLAGSSSIGVLKEPPFSFALIGANGFDVRALQWKSPKLAS